MGAPKLGGEGCVAWAAAASARRALTATGIAHEAELAALALAMRQVALPVIVSWEKLSGQRQNQFLTVVD